jgi:hypothetical protein
MSGNAGQFESKAAEEMGIRPVDDPPRGFDPVTAADAELARYGYPRRPDQATQPQAYQRWKWVVSPPTTRTAALFGQTHPVPSTPGGVIGPGFGIQPGSQEASGNWAGRIAGVAYSQYPIETIYGGWTVPRILQPPNGSNYMCASWIGLDGRE